MNQLQKLIDFLTCGWFVGPESQTGALRRRQVRAQQMSILIGCCPIAAGKEQEVTWRKEEGKVVNFTLFFYTLDK